MPLKDGLGCERRRKDKVNLWISLIISLVFLGKCIDWPLEIIPHDLH